MRIRSYLLSPPFGMPNIPTRNRHFPIQYRIFLFFLFRFPNFPIIISEVAGARLFFFLFFFALDVFSSCVLLCSIVLLQIKWLYIDPDIGRDCRTIVEPLRTFTIEVIICSCMSPMRLFGCSN